MLNEQFLSVFKVTGLNRLKQKSPHYSLSYFFFCQVDAVGCWVCWLKPGSTFFHCLLNKVFHHIRVFCR